MTESKQYIGTKRVSAIPMTRQQYNDYRGWQLPDDEDGSDEGYLVEYVDGGQSNHPDHAGYISWSPKAVFEQAYQPQVESLAPTDAEKAFEDMLIVKRLNAPRVQLEALHKAIQHVDIIRHTAPSGAVLRFAILCLDNGFTVMGRPSVSASPANDDNDVGVQVALENAIHEVWPFLGFRVVEGIHKAKS